LALLLERDQPHGDVASLLPVPQDLLGVEAPVERLGLERDVRQVASRLCGPGEQPIGGGHLARLEQTHGPIQEPPHVVRRLGLAPVNRVPALVGTRVAAPREEDEQEERADPSESTAHRPPLSAPRGSKPRPDLGGPPR
jgi:hypothetical protein